MRAIVIFATLMAGVLGRPDVSHLGYKYQQPGGSSGSTGYSSSGSSSGGYNAANNYAGQGYTDLSSFGSSQSAATTDSGYTNGYNAQVASSGSISSGTNGFTSGGDYSSSSSSGFAGGSAQAGGINLIQGQSQSFDLTGGSSGGQRVVYKPVIKQGEPIITKNFYVHAAPEEDENVRVEEKVQVVRPQKTYKIIFIKAPSSGSSINAVNYPAYPQNEEKTIVYVLSKKDEGIADIGEIPVPPPAVTHKPEVFFIKYKTKQEAVDAVANIQTQLHSELQPQSSFGTTGADYSSQSSSGTTGPDYSSQSSSGTTGEGTISQSSSGTGFSTGSSSGSDVFVQSSSSVTPGNTFDPRITPDDAPVDISSLGKEDAEDNSKTYESSSSSQTQFGPSGGQVNLQSISFSPAGGHSQTTYTQETGNGISGHVYSQQSNGYSTDSTGSSAEFVPQNFIKIDANKSAFKPQLYLTPNFKY